jgi:O-antigen/teichoic acid export membrane protein
LGATCLGYWHRARQSDFVAKVGETFLTRIMLVGIGLITTVIVARMLGPEGRGIYAVATTVAAIGVQFGNLGLHASNTYYVAQDRALLSALLSNSLVISFGLGSLGTVLGGLIFWGWPNLAPVQGLPLMICLGWIPFGLAYLLMQNLLLGIHEIRKYNKIDLLSKTGGLGLIILLVMSRLVYVETVLLCTLATVIIGFTWSFLSLGRNLGRLPLPSLALFWKNLHYGIKAYLAALFSFLVFRINLLMIKYLLGAEQTGYYSIASIIADMMCLFPAVAGTILFPRLSAMASRGEKWSLTKKVAWATGLCMLAGAVGAALLAGPAIRLLFGEAFLPAVPALIWLLPGVVILSVNICYMNYFAAMGMPMVTVYSPALAVLINILLNLALIPSLGIVGASLAAVAAYSAMLMTSLVYIHSGRGAK